MRSHIQPAFILGRWFAVLVIAASCMAQSQTQKATITGTVTDITRAPVPKAVIALKATDGQVLQTTTDGDGRFAIEGAPGEYVLTIFSQGFRSVTKAVHLTAAAPKPEQIILEIGDCHECVTVVEGPALDLLNERLDLLVPALPLPPYKISARPARHIHA